MKNSRLLHDVLGVIFLVFLIIIFILGVKECHERPKRKIKVEECVEYKIVKKKGWYYGYSWLFGKYKWMYGDVEENICVNWKEVIKETY